MPKRSRKPVRGDFNQRARSIVDQATGASTPVKKKRPAKKKAEKAKDPAAVSLGRKGGLKGGPARAKKMTAEERAESARKAALARWASRNILTTDKRFAVISALVEGCSIRDLPLEPQSEQAAPAAEASQPPRPATRIAQPGLLFGDED